jgi:hypothetical protein
LWDRRSCDLKEVVLRSLSPGKVVRLSFLLALAACASSPGSSTRRTSPDELTAGELRESNASTAYEAITRLRPNWLRATGGTSISGGVVRSQAILLYLDGNRLHGGLDALKTLSLGGIRSMQWLDATKAATVLSGIGSEPFAGAISIKSQ